MKSPKTDTVCLATNAGSRIRSIEDNRKNRDIGIGKSV